MIELPILNLPKYDFKFKKENNTLYIYDSIRTKYVKLTPEEWVRQNYIEFLINDKKISRSLIVVEKEIVINDLKKRFDIVVYNKDYNPDILIECKAPNIKIVQNVFEQIAAYNIILKCKYLVVTNGLSHYFCEVNLVNKEVKFIEKLPDFNKKA